LVISHAGLFRRAIVFYDSNMEPEQTMQRPGPLPVQGGAFSWRGLACALLGGIAAGLIWAWIAHVWHSYAALKIVFPILLGVFTGLTITGLTRFVQIGHRPTILLVTILAAVVAVLGQHYFRCLSFDKPFWSELAARGFGWIALDALLAVAAAVFVILPAIRIPFCNRCNTWYRTVRNGKIDLPTARRLAETCGVEDIEKFHSPRYRLSCCHGGCGPTCCELTWEDSNGSLELARVWLDGEKRNEVGTILDKLVKEEDSEN